MRAILCDRLDGPAGLRLVDLPRPEPGPGELLVKVRAAALNFPDVLMTSGGYQHKPTLPYTPGMEAAGEIEALGSGVEGWRIADRIAFGGKTGCFADYALARATDGSILRLPADWSFAEGAAFQVAAKTAYHALVHRGRLQAGETLLVNGATGGVGLAAVQLGVHLGATVIATGGDDAKLEVVKAQGAKGVLNVRTAPEFAPAVKELTGGRGADVVYDPVGGAVFDQSIRAAAVGARILIIGFTAGAPAALKTNHALIKQLTVMGVRAGEASRHDPKIARDYAVEFPKLMAQGVMRPHVSHRFPLERTGDAMQAMIDRRIVGKAVVEIA